MEYISNKYNVYDNYLKNDWNLLTYFKGTVVILKNGEKLKF